MKIQVNNNFRAVFNPYILDLAVWYGGTGIYYKEFEERDEWAVVNFNQDPKSNNFLSIHCHYVEQLQLIVYPKIFDPKSELRSSTIFTNLIEVWKSDNLLDDNSTKIRIARGDKEFKELVESFLKNRMSNKYTDVMIDIETLGTSPGAPIMEIGAVVFNANTDFISKKYTFRSTLDSEAQIRDGFISRKDTIDWWQRTNPSLYKGLRSSSKDYKKVAEDFEKWFKKIDSKYSPVRLWGNSARFDIGILEAFYKKIRGNSFESFWSSWNERCVRTIFNIDSGVRPTIKFEGTPHDPIDDATHQIKVLQAIIKKHKLVIT